MAKACQCGGIIRQHEMTGGREAWTCGACGRYQIMQPHSNPYSQIDDTQPPAVQEPQATFEFDDVEKPLRRA